MINHSVQTVIDEYTEHWGIKVTVVEVKDVGLPQSMQRAMAKQAEAEREKRAKVLLAQGEFLAAQTLADAARLMATEPAAITLRYLQTLTEIAVEKNSTIVFPLPMDILTPLGRLLRRASGEADALPVVPPAVSPTSRSPVAVEAAGSTGLLPPRQA
jgi:regulator of protease activity HflC (stomatin/prohibitin superfamily)